MVRAQEIYNGVGQRSAPPGEPQLSNATSELFISTRKMKPPFLSTNLVNRWTAIIYWAIITTAACFNSEVKSATLRVSTSGNDSSGNGLMTAPYATIQKAIDVAAAGDVVEVLAGTYSGTGNRQINLKGKAITVRSAEGAFRTTLDLGRQQAFVATTGESLNTVVDGFTITNGYVSHGQDWAGKGIVEAKNAGLTIRNCIFRGNETAVSYLTSASAIIWKTGDLGSEMLVENCLFYKNVIKGGKWGAVGFARVICGDGPVKLNVSRCTIAHNQLTSDGTAGGMAITTIGAVENTIVWENGPGVPCGINAPGVSYTVCDTGVQNQSWQTVSGALTFNPLFSNATAGDYSLKSGSPARNAGNPSSPLDSDGSRADIGWAKIEEIKTVTIVEFPQPLVLTEGSTATFRVSAAGGSPLNYQWYKGYPQNPINGAIYPELTIPNVRMEDSGEYMVNINYDHRVFNSAFVTLQVRALPSISLQPAAVTAVLGGSAVLSVSASGTSPLAYQWKKDGVNITGATNATYSVNSVQIADAGSYSVMVSNEAGSVTSRTAVLTVNTTSLPNSPLGWGANSVAGRLSTPASLKDCVDIKCGIDHTVALFRDGTVRAWGTSEATSVPAGLSGVKQIDVGWAWILGLKNDGSLVAWGANDSRQVSTLPSGTGFTKVSAGNMHGAAIRSGKLVCWGRNDYGQCNIPASVSGASEVLDVVAAGHSTAAILGDKTVRVWGADVPSIPSSLTNVKAIGFNGSNLVALKTDGTVVVVGNDPLLTAVPAGLSNVTRIYLIGNSVAAVKRDGSIVSWGKTGAGTIGQLPTLPAGSTWTSLSGKWEHAYGVVSSSSADSDSDGYTDSQEFAEGTDPYAATSFPVTKDIVTIVEFPQPLVVTEGGTATFRVAAAGGSPLNYQWYKGYPQNPINGAIYPELTIPNVRVEDSGEYMVNINYDRRIFNSAFTTLQVRALPSISLQPAAVTAVIGGSAVLSVSASGTSPLAYQWMKDGVEIPGATQGVLSIASIQPRHIGYYSCRVTDSVGAVTSHTARLGVPNVPFGIWQGMVGHYEFGGGYEDSSVFANSVANRTDVVLGTDRFGAANNALQFSTTHAIASTERNVPIGGNDNRTIAFWFKMAAEPKGKAIGVGWGDGSSRGASIQLVVNSNGFEPVSLWSHYADVIAGGYHGFTYDQWHHVAVVYSGLLSTAQFFVDGAAAGTSTNTWATLRSDLSTKQTPLKFGALTFEPNNGFMQEGALLDDVRIYNRTLSASEVFELYSIEKASTPDTTPPVLSLPTNIAVNASSASGASVTYPAATATDNVTASPTITYSNASGTVFPLGVTTVTVTATDAAGNVSTGSFTVTVSESQEPLKILVPPSSLDLKVGEAATFLVIASGKGPIRYQWRKDGTPIAGATVSTFTIPRAEAASAGDYDVVVSNAAGSVVSASARLSVALSPVVTLPPAHATVGVGLPVSFSVSATGSAPLAYQWRKDGVPITGATVSTFTIPRAEAASAGDYDVVVSNAAGSVVSASALLSVVLPPVVTLPPAPVKAGVGHPVSFSVSASGSAPLSYQWRKDGAPIVGATASILSIASAEETRAGDYDVVVTNAAGSVWSSKARLSVVLMPVITRHPAAVTVRVGSPASFSVSATSTEPLFYTWFKDGEGIAGATSATLEIPSVQTADVGNYSVTVNHFAGGVGSFEAALRISEPIVIGSQPSSQTVSVGEEIRLSVAASGQGQLKYQWRKGSVILSGATSAELIIGSATEEDAGSYSVVVSSENESVTSRIASVYITKPVNDIKITTQPVSKTLLVGDAFSLSVKATGTGNLSYRWRKNGVPITGATSALFVLASAVLEDEGAYDVVVSSATGSATSQPANVVVNLPARILRHPASLTVNEGQLVYLSVNAEGTGEMKYQWRKGGVPIQGATSETLEIEASTVGDAGSYSVVVTDSAGSSATSLAAMVSVNRLQDALTILTHPVSQAVNLGSRVVMSISARSEYPVTYQWRKNGVNIPRANGPTLTLATVSKLDEGQYDAVVSTVAGQLISDPATVSLLEKVAITTHPVSQSAMEGQMVAFRVKVSGSGPITFQWKKGARILQDSNADTLVFDSVSAADAGDYSVVVSNVLGSISSGVAKLTIDSAPSVTIDAPTDGARLIAESVLLRGRATDNGWIDRVEVNVNGQATREAVITEVKGTPGNWAWTLSLQTGAEGLRGGENSVSVRAFDSNGNASPVVDRNFFFAAKRPDTAGSYLGLAEPTENASESMEYGLTSLTITKAGTFSGRIQFLSAMTTVSGTFNDEGEALFGNLQSPRLPVWKGSGASRQILGYLEMSLDLTGEYPAIDVRVWDAVDGEILVAQGMLEKAVYTSLKTVPVGMKAVPKELHDPAAEKGAYTLLLDIPEDFKSAVDDQSGQEVYPQGSGYGRMTLSASGMVIWVGKLADGAGIAFSSRLTASNRLPVHVPLYLKKGLFTGHVQFDPEAGDSDATGMGLRWFKPPGPKSAPYAAGWGSGVDVELVASKYLAPKPVTAQDPYPGTVFGTLVPGVPAPEVNLTLVAFGGGLEQEATYECNLNARNLVSPMGSAVVDRMKISFTAATGAFTGSFVNPETGKAVTINGMVLQKTQTARGNFLSPSARFGEAATFGGIRITPLF